MSSFANKIKELERLMIATAPLTRKYEKYKYNPVEFIEEILKVKLTPQQKDVCTGLLQPPNRLIVNSGHSIGKTKISACLGNWFFCTRDPAIIIITAPVASQLIDTTFKEIRSTLPDEMKQYLSPKAPQVFHHESHKITGYTADTSSSFQGRHENNILCIGDEHSALSADVITAMKGMCSGGDDAYILLVGNPLDTSSAAYLEEQSGSWTVRQMSALDHPNIINELKGEPAIIPSAVRLANLRLNMKGWFDEVSLEDHETSEAGFTDIVFDGKILRPNPLGDARVLGRYPQLSLYSIFSEADFRTACNSKTTFSESQPYEIGMDYARFGDDKTVITVRRGKVIVHMEEWTHANTKKIANRLKQLCEEYSYKMDGRIMPYQISVRCDDDGCGGGVVDQRGEFKFIPVNSGSLATNESGYPNKRSELLFDLREKMRNGLSFAGLSQDQIQELRKQMLTILYKLDPKGRRVAEPKADTKKRIMRSPDNLDSLALCAYDYTGTWEYREIDFKREIGLERFTVTQNPLLGAVAFLPHDN